MLAQQSCFLESFLKAHDNSGISLTAFLSRSNLKLYNIPATPKLVKRILTDLDSSPTSVLDCIPLVALNNCELTLSYTLAELFNLCLHEFCFSGFLKV